MKKKMYGIAALALAFSMVTGMLAGDLVSAAEVNTEVVAVQEPETTQTEPAEVTEETPTDESDSEKTEAGEIVAEEPKAEEPKEEEPKAEEPKTEEPTASEKEETPVTPEVQAEPAEEKLIGEKPLGIYTVTASTLNVRKGPGTSYDKTGSLAKGKTVDVYEIKNGWARIKYNGANAWVSASYLSLNHNHAWDSGKVTKAATSTATGERTYTCTKCSSTYKTVVPAGNTESGEGVVTDPEPEQDVPADTANEKLIGEKPLGIYSVTASSLNVRKGAGTSYTKVGTLEKGKTVDVYEIKDGWARIKYNGANAWVSASYLSLNHNHVWNSGKVTKAATLTTTGEKTYTCTKCSSTYKVVVPVIIPDPVEDNVGDPVPEEKVTFTVSYDANGGEGTMAATTVVYGEATALAANKFTNGDYTFIGWYAYRTSDSKWFTEDGWKTDAEVEADGSEKHLYSDKQYIATTSYVNDDEVVMYAQWKMIAYEISYDANGGEGTMPETKALYGRSTPLAKNEFTNGTKDFRGWTAYRTSDNTWLTRSNGWQTKEVIDAKGYVLYEYADQQSITLTSTVNGDQYTMYAQWGPIHYTIKYNANGGSGSMASTTVTYGVSTPLRANSFEHEEKSFGGWTAYRTSDKTWFTSSGWKTAEEISEAKLDKYVYADQQAVAKTSSVDGDVVIMYAMWVNSGSWRKVNGTWTYTDQYGTFSGNKMYEAWSKIKTKSSPTKYYIVVDCTACETYIFIGKAGNWEPFRKWKCSPGRQETKTVQGTFEIGSRGYSFSKETLTCYYWTQFKGKYLFHTILYKKGTWTVLNGTLGKQLSHGCVRLATENAKWIYDNMPSKTKVLTYY